MLNLKLLILIISVSFSTSIAAKEPINVGVLREQLIHYHDSGEYNKEIKLVINQACAYLKKQISLPQNKNRKLAIILDIDDTALSNYHYLSKLNFGGTEKDWNHLLKLGTNPVIAPTLKFYKFAKSHDIAVFFITGRDETKRQATIYNLKHAGYHRYDGLIFRSRAYLKTKAAEYKSKMRAQIAAKGYDIIMNIGDQQSDFTGLYSGKSFKLPNPYYLIN